MITDADSFFLEYPQAATPLDKALLLSGLLLLDFMYY